MLKVKADTNMTQKTKDRRYDGRSRPTNDLYKKNFDRIFGKKEKKIGRASCRERV